MEKNKIRVAIAVMLFSALACQKHSENSDAMSINNQQAQTLAYYKERALERGDTNAYYNLSSNYIDSPNESFLYTALIMANRYKYNLAFYDVYSCLTDLYHKKDFTELDSLDPKTRAIALEYLIEGANQNNKDCQRILGHHYQAGTYIQRDSVKGSELINKSSN